MLEPRRPESRLQYSRVGSTVGLAVYSCCMTSLIYLCIHPNICCVQNKLSTVYTHYTMRHLVMIMKSRIDTKQRLMLDILDSLMF